MRRYRAGLLIVAAVACVAVLGAAGGCYVADRAALRSDETADPVSSSGAPASPDGGTGNTGSTSAASSGDGGPSTRTYRINRLMYRQGSVTVTLVSAETAAGSLRVNLRYRNDSPVEWPLTCPDAEDDRNHSRLALPDGQIVHSENTWCATNRPGASFSIAPGGQLNSWGVFPMVPEIEQPFQLTWYDFPTLDDIRLS